MEIDDIVDPITKKGTQSLNYLPTRRSATNSRHDGGEGEGGDVIEVSASKAEGEAKGWLREGLGNAENGIA